LKRFVCIVEGHGEASAVSTLVARIVHHLGASDAWKVDKDPVRHPRTRLVLGADASHPGMPNEPGLRAALAIACAREASGVLVLVDADDDCAAKWGPAAKRIIEERVQGAAIMVVREYEAWLLWAKPAAEVARVARDPNRKRDAKGALAKIVPGYKPSTHQLSETKALPIEVVRQHAPSFDKFVREIERIVRGDSSVRSR